MLAVGDMVKSLPGPELQLVIALLPRMIITGSHLHIWVERETVKENCPPPPKKKQIGKINFPRRHGNPPSIVERLYLESSQLYKAVGKFPKALYGTTVGTCSAQLFRPACLCIDSKCVTSLHVYRFNMS